MVVHCSYKKKKNFFILPPFKILFVHPCLKTLNSLKLSPLSQFSPQSRPWNRALRRRSHRPIPNHLEYRLVSATAASTNHDGEDVITDSVVYSGNSSSNGGCCGCSVAGILYKWINYGKGWRGRWFMLEDGVLSYYKIHSLDKILMSSTREKGVRVIDEDSIRYMRKANWSSNSSNCFNSSAKHYKPFGEVHLKVCFYFYF